MTDEFSISLRFVALRTADLDRSREFYANLLGLNVCGEKPGSSSSSPWATPLCAWTWLMPRSRPQRSSPSEGWSSCASALKMRGCQWRDPRKRALGTTSSCMTRMVMSWSLSLLKR